MRMYPKKTAERVINRRAALVHTGLRSNCRRARRRNLRGLFGLRAACLVGRPQLAASFKPASTRRPEKSYVLRSTGSLEARSALNWGRLPTVLVRRARPAMTQAYEQAFSRTIVPQKGPPPGQFQQGPVMRERGAVPSPAVLSELDTRQRNLEQSRVLRIWTGQSPQPPAPSSPV